MADSGTEDEGVPTSLNDSSVEASLADTPQITVTHLSQAVNGGHSLSSGNIASASLHIVDTDEPVLKRSRLEDEDPDLDSDLSAEQSIKQILFNINKAICLRLDSIENKLESVTMTTRYLEEKVEQICQQVRQNNAIPTSALKPHVSMPFRRSSSAVIVGLPQDRANATGMPRAFGTHIEGINSQGKITVQVDDGPGDFPGIDQSLHNLGPNVQLITLNTEEDYPHGTWLGDESNPEMRVRVPILPSDLLHVHSNCRTPEKMALTLLDYLFDRETQASSNLSGMGKHGKKQLDPLMIYGIRCHLIYRFGITEQDWHRIKQNIDSKCRTAWRRKVKGLPLTVKAFRGKAPPTYVHMGLGGELVSDDSLQEDSELHIQGEVDLAGGVMQPASAAEIIQSAGGEIQVLHATPEQVAQLQQAHQIQILQGDASQLMGFQLQGHEGHESGIQVAVSLPQQEGLQVINTDNVETIQVSRTDNNSSGEDSVIDIQESCDGVLDMQNHSEPGDGP